MIREDRSLRTVREDEEEILYGNYSSAMKVIAVTYCTCECILILHDFFRWAESCGIGHSEDGS